MEKVFNFPYSFKSLNLTSYKVSDYIHLQIESHKESIDCISEIKKFDKMCLIIKIKENSLKIYAQKLSRITQITSPF